MKQNKNTDKNSDKRLKNLKPPFKKGESGNPNGRPLGKKNYETLIREAIVEYAKKNAKTPEEIEGLIYQQAINMAVKGEFNFFRDLMDRLHGKPKDTVDLTGEIKISKLEEMQKGIQSILNNKK